MRAALLTRCWQNIFKSKKFLKSEKEEEEVSSSDDEEEAREIKNPVRRVSVSAESLSPEDQAETAKVVIPKSDDQKRRIEVAIRNNFLFKNLDSTQQQEVIDAMFEKPVAAGEDIIKQGAKGDFFYIIDSGAFDVYVSKGGAEPIKVVSYTPGASFGELALMYNAPRYVILSRQSVRSFLRDANRLAMWAHVAGEGNSSSHRQISCQVYVHMCA